jgi:7-carboxy-7-deazaguanine synthase (Cx14CxxC type)
MSKVYSVKEMYYTLQGEGAHTGRPAVFLRFAGCNLWSGREEHRAEAICKFCDTQFVGTDGPGGGKFNSAVELAEVIDQLWPGGPNKYVVCTGGEPLLQVDETLVDAFHQREFAVAVETNGTVRAPKGLDWICVSPKADAAVVQTTGNELKLVYPQKEKTTAPNLFEHLKFDHFFLQPLQNEQWSENTQAAVQYCLEHPKWRLSLQTHKYLNIP